MKFRLNQFYYKLLFIIIMAGSLGMNAQYGDITYLGGTTASAKGKGTAGLPSLTWDIPAGKNRVMILSFYFERDHRPDDASNWPSGRSNPADPTTIGAAYFPLTAGGVPLAGRLALRHISHPGGGSTADFALYSATFYAYTLTDAGGLPTGITTFDFSGINAPNSDADEVIVMVEVYGNVNPATSYTATIPSTVVPYPTSAPSLSVTVPAAATPILGRTLGDNLNVAFGTTSHDIDISVNTPVWTVINGTVRVTNNDDNTNPGVLPWANANLTNAGEPDGIAMITVASSGDTDKLLQISNANGVDPLHFATRLTAFRLLPLAKPRVVGRVYRDFNGFPVDNGGGSGGYWNIANSLWVNAVNTDGNVVATALVTGGGTPATNGFFTFPEGSNLVEGELITFQLSKTQGVIGQPAPPKELPVGWGTMGESITGGASDGTPNGEFTVTIGSASMAANAETYRFGVTACAAGVTAPSVQNLSNNCPVMTVNLSVAHTGSVPAGAELRWFTNNTHTGTPLSGTAITEAGAGTYYAFYYDSTGNCYSPSAAVTVTINSPCPVFINYPCDEILYISIGGKFYKYNYDGTSEEMFTMAHEINAVGLSPTGALWAWDFDDSKVVRIDKDGNFYPMTIPNLPLINYNTGTVDANGYYYILNDAGNRFYIIDTDPARPATYGQLVDPNANGGIVPYQIDARATKGTAVTAVNPANNANVRRAVSDWAVNPDNGMLYALTNNVGANNPFPDFRRRLLQYNPVTGVAQYVSGQMSGGGIGTGDSYGAFFIDFSGNYYVYNNSAGHLLQLNLTTNTATQISTTVITGNRVDGANCLLPYCFRPANTDGNTYPTKHGITALGRAGADNGNWPMVRQSAWTALEAKTKGFVPNRVKFNVANKPVAEDGVTLVITTPVEGMIVYDTTNNCLKVYTSKDDGATFDWYCMGTQTCPR